MFLEQSWGERRDSNPRSPGPQPGALTNLATLTTPQKSLASAMKEGQRKNQWEPTVWMNYSLTITQL